jgi:GWxTD domain-containing protein
MNLETNRDRDIFIENFWKQRDPTPGTPQNEYRDEIIKRFNYSNKFFSRGTSREGWMTDMGRFYIILGKPASKHDFSGRRGKTLDEQRINFIVSTSAEVPHTVAQAKMISMPNNVPFYFMLANQYEKIGNFEKAEALYQKGYDLSLHNKNGLIGYVYFLFKVKKYEKSLQLIETIKGDEKLRFDYFLAKGMAYMEMGKYADAIENLLEGKKIYNSDTVLLNALGTSYYRTSQKEKALSALKPSLRLNPEQGKIKKLIGEIEKKLP